MAEEEVALKNPLPSGVAYPDDVPHYANGTPGRQIVSLPGVVGGEPIIEGTRVPVKSVVLLAQAYRHQPDALRNALPALTEGDIRDALRYYDEHRDEIDGHITADEAEDALPL